MTTLADDLAALIAAREAATKGPWRQGTGIHDNWVLEPVPIDAIGIAGERKDTRPIFTGQTSSRTGWAADAAFIAMSANVIEAHGAELAALVARPDYATLYNVARLRAALEEAWSFIASDWGGTGAEDVERIRQPLLATITAALDAALRGPS
jgi:hypothetical protein